MPEVGRRAAARSFTWSKEAKSFRDQYTFDSFQSVVSPWATTTGGAPSTTLAAVNAFADYEAVYEQNNTTSQTSAPVPLIVAPGPPSGLNVALDTTSGKIVEIVPGGSTIRGRNAYLTAASAGPSGPALPAGSQPFFVRIKFSIGTVTSWSVNFGFRATQAYQTTLASYTDFATLQVAAGGVIGVQTQIATGGVVSSTPLSGASAAIANWANGETHELRIECGFNIFGGSNNYAVRFLYDNNILTGVPLYTFGLGLTLVPFWFATQGATSSGQVLWQLYESGLLEQNAIGRLPSFPG